MTFDQQLIITVLDKGIFALVLAIMSFFLSRSLKSFEGRQQSLLASVQAERTAMLDALKGERDLRNELEKLKVSRLLELRERQLAEFYWPLVFRLEIEKVVWEKIAELRQGSDRDRQLARRIEETVIVPNDEAILQILQSKIHLSESDEPSLTRALEYVGQAATFKATRELERESVDPTAPLRDTSLTRNFHSNMRTIALTLQQRYDQELEFIGAGKHGGQALPSARAGTALHESA